MDPLMVVFAVFLIAFSALAFYKGFKGAKKTKNPDLNRTYPGHPDDWTDAQWESVYGK